MAERDLPDCGDEGKADEPFPAVFTLTSTEDGEGGAAVSGMGQLQGVGPKIVLAQGTHSTPRRGSGTEGIREGKRPPEESI
jgi:hypothetical protein